MISILFPVSCSHSPPVYRNLRLSQSCTWSSQHVVFGPNRTKRNTFRHWANCICGHNLLTQAITASNTDHTSLQPALGRLVSRHHHRQHPCLAIKISRSDKPCQLGSGTRKLQSQMASHPCLVDAVIEFESSTDPSIRFNRNSPSSLTFNSQQISCFSLSKPISMAKISQKRFIFSVDLSMTWLSMLPEEGKIC